MVGLCHINDSGSGGCRRLSSRHRWWWLHCCVVDRGGGVVVALLTKVVGWWKMERVRTRDLEKILKCPCLRVFVYIIISAH